MLAINDNNSMKTQDIRFKLVSFDSIRLTLQLNIRNIYISLLNNILFSKNLRLSCISHTEYLILAMIVNISLKPQDIRFKLVSYDRIRLTLQVHIKNMYLS